VWDNTQYHSEEEVGKTKQALRAIAEFRVLLVNSQKFGITALHRVGDLAEFDVVITDAGISGPDLDRLREEKLEVRVAKLEPG
jgi:DeoR/GlpR family transcriptional regulator of sugar metabolism